MENKQKPAIVAEIGCNHCGRMETAEELIKMAALFCNADYAKFQKRNPKELLADEQYAAPHPNPHNSYGSTYGEHREFLEFTLDQHRQLMEWCELYGIKYACSVWDMTSAKEIASLSPEFIKIPSASNTHLEMLSLLCNEFKGDIHISLGMTTDKEKEIVVDLLNRHGRLKDTVLYHCTSGYPVPFEQCYLMEIRRLHEQYGDVVRAIGFSGHHLGIAVDNAAYALGARWFERHYTLDRTQKGTDHAASLEPDGLRRLCRDVKATAKTMGYKPEEITEIEKPQRDKLKWKG